MRSTLRALALALLVTAPAFADVWDLQTINDDSGTVTRNELVHGTTQTHDLAVRPGPLADQDWYRMWQKPYASYEVLVDGLSGDVAQLPPGILHRLDGTTVLQESGSIVGNSFTRALWWINTTTSSVSQLIRVANPACGTSCGADDTYTIRARETTVNVARWNASGTQATVLVTQNTSEHPVAARFHYWNGAGTLLQTVEASLPPKTQTVVNLATIPGLSGQSGHITIAFAGAYGALNVKAVALEPATGFTFDTPGVNLPY
jgi:hypothetical protein